jgi:hypothetical protein
MKVCVQTRRSTRRLAVPASEYDFNGPMVLQNSIDLDWSLADQFGKVEKWEMDLGQCHCSWGWFHNRRSFELYLQTTEGQCGGLVPPATAMVKTKATFTDACISSGLRSSPPSSGWYS